MKIIVFRLNNSKKIHMRLRSTFIEPSSRHSYALVTKYPKTPRLASTLPPNQQS